MRRLNRDALGPVCLKNYHHGKDKWDRGSPSVPERGEIWGKLNAMQDGRCAYCETLIQEGSRHIEHFRQRDRYPQGTFDWDNLFGSCLRNGICGVHKDQCGLYAPADLIKPDVEDPDEFLVFDPQGGIRPKEGLTHDKHRRATETIRILNLDGGGLPHMRRAAAVGYLKTIEGWAEVAEQLPEAEWRPLVEEALAEELSITDHLPFATAIRHALTEVCRRLGPPGI